MADPGILSLAGLGIALGLRHGIDWDHLAAITDITSATVTTDETTRESADSLSSLARAATLAPQAGTLAVAAAPGLGEMRVARVHYGRMARVDTPRRQEAWHGFFLATMYALGHASLVVALGLLAIWFGTLLPDWIDPLMGRIVGLTLLFLGVWIIYSLVRYGRDFRLQSRWMVLIALARNGWERLRSRITGEPVAHHHEMHPIRSGNCLRHRRPARHRRRDGISGAPPRRRGRGYGPGHRNRAAPLLCSWAAHVQLPDRSLLRVWLRLGEHPAHRVSRLRHLRRGL